MKVTLWLSFYGKRESFVCKQEENRFADINKDQLIPLAALNVDEAYITSIKEVGILDLIYDLVPKLNMSTLIKHRRNTSGWL
jgi:hypothetical protein